MIQLKHHSGVHTLSCEQLLPITMKEAWDFFSSPRNLSKITPYSMGFEITSQLVGKMHAGQIITYKVALLPGLRSNWVTEITHVDEGKYFVDEQRSGPYAIWHHEHRFTEVDNGVLVSDKITYKVPLGILGQVMDWLYIRKELRGIFQFRAEVLSKMFPAMTD